MRAPHVIACWIVAALAVFSGCDANQATHNSPKNTGERKSPAVDVAALDKAGDKELAEPGKAEAKQWLKDSSHAVFQCSKESVVKFVDEAYAAGAVKIYVTGIEEMGGAEVTASLLLVLPKEPAARAKLFEISNRFGETVQNDPDKDVGQKYLSFALD